MDLQPAQRPAEVVPSWSASKTARSHHAPLLHGATVTGEAARDHLSVRIGLWLDDAGRVRQARWRSSEGGELREYAEVACALLEARADPAQLDGEALRNAATHAGHADGADLVAAAVHAALLQGGAAENV